MGGVSEEGEYVCGGVDTTCVRLGCHSNCCVVYKYIV